MLNSLIHDSLAHVRRAAKPAARISLLCAVVVALFATLAHTRAADTPAQDIQKLNRFVQTSNSPSVKIFREGRDLIEEGQWAKAAEKFQSFVNAFQKDPDIDAALYWLAYAYKQQGLYREAAQPLNRLLKKYPQSSWADEGEAMLVEIAPHLGQDSLPVAVLNEKKDDELKIVALQSLFEADEERAIAYVGEWLKTNSTATKSMKQAAVSLLGSHGGARAVPVLLDIARHQSDASLREMAVHRLGEIGGENVADGLMNLYTQESSTEVKARILRAFADMHDSPRAQARLLEVAQTESSPELRKTAIRWLADGLGANAYDALAKIYQTERTREIKVQVLRALADMNDARARGLLVEVARGTRGEDAELRQAAIRWLADHADEQVASELSKVYAAEQSLEIKTQILRSLADMHNVPNARARLFEAARGESNLELRAAVIRWIADGGDEQAIGMLVSLYDAEQNLQIKRALIQAFGDSRQKSALRKLMDVARRDPSVELRKRAIRLIGESRDPEALKFLEDILK